MKRIPGKWKKYLDKIKAMNPQEKREHHLKVSREWAKKWRKTHPVNLHEAGSRYRKKHALHIRLLGLSWRERNPEKVNELYHKQYEKNKEKYLEIGRNWHHNNPEKVKVHSIVYRAKKAGLIEQKPCVVCGSWKSTAHHTDYEKPFEITWLCQKHHSRLHFSCVI